MRTRMGVATSMSFSKMDNHRCLPSETRMNPVTAELISYSAKEPMISVVRQLNHVGLV
jgi:hypothetical protein